MGIFEKVKGAAESVAKRNQETHIKLHVTSGRKIFQLDFYESNVILRVNDEGFVYFDDIVGRYKVSDFEWEGAMYDTVSTTTGRESSSFSSKTKGKDKRSGHAIGAGVGWSGFGAGAAFGSMNGRSRESTKGIGRSKMKSTTIDSQREVSSPAYMTLIDPINNYEFSFGFDCDSTIYGELRNVFLTSWYNA